MDESLADDANRADMSGAVLLVKLKIMEKKTHVFNAGYC